jgi:hypothetical protein
VPDVPNGLSLNPPHKTKKQKQKKNTSGLDTIERYKLDTSSDVDAYPQATITIKFLYDIT